MATLPRGTYSYRINTTDTFDYGQITFEDGAAGKEPKELLVNDFFQLALQKCKFYKGIVFDHESRRVKYEVLVDARGNEVSEDYQGATTKVEKDLWDYGIDNWNGYEEPGYAPTCHLLIPFYFKVTQGSDFIKISVSFEESLGGDPTSNFETIVSHILLNKDIFCPPGTYRRFVQWGDEVGPMGTVLGNWGEAMWKCVEGNDEINPDTIEQMREVAKAEEWTGLLDIETFGTLHMLSHFADRNVYNGTNNVWVDDVDLDCPIICCLKYVEVTKVSPNSICIKVVADCPDYIKGIIYWDYPYEYTGACPKEVEEDTRTSCRFYIQNIDPETELIIEPFSINDKWYSIVLNSITAGEITSDMPPADVIALNDDYDKVATVRLTYNIDSRTVQAIFTLLRLTNNPEWNITCTELEEHEGIFGQPWQPQEDGDCVPVKDITSGSASDCVRVWDINIEDTCSPIWDIKILPDTINKVGGECIIGGPCKIIKAGDLEKITEYDINVSEYIYEYDKIGTYKVRVEIWDDCHIITREVFLGVDVVGEPDDPDSPRCIPVTDINPLFRGNIVIGVPTEISGVVFPFNATHQSIIWSVIRLGTTAQYEFDGSLLTALSLGEIILRGTVQFGECYNTFTTDFEVEVSPEYYCDLIIGYEINEGDDREEHWIYTEVSRHTLPVVLINPTDNGVNWKVGIGGIFEATVLSVDFFRKEVVTGLIERRGTFDVRVEHTGNPDNFVDTLVTVPVDNYRIRMSMIPCEVQESEDCPPWHEFVNGQCKLVSTLPTCPKDKVTVYAELLENGQCPPGYERITLELTGITTNTNSPRTGDVIETTLIPSAGTATYQWYRGTSSSDVTTAISNARMSSYIPVVADANRYLRVVATGTGNYVGTVEHTLSNAVISVTKLPTPVLGDVTAIDSGTIKVQWTAVTNASSYRIEYATNAGFTTGTGNVSATGTTVDITELSGETTYYIRMMAIGTGSWGNSDYSTSKSITTPKEIPEEKFSFTIELDSERNNPTNEELTFRIPIFNASSANPYNWNIDWGDGTGRVSTAGSSPINGGISHQYSRLGTYTITIRPGATIPNGWLRAFSFTSTTSTGTSNTTHARHINNKRKVISVNTPFTVAMFAAEDATALGNGIAAQMFYDCQHLGSVACGFEQLTTVTTVGNDFARGMFNGCYRQYKDDEGEIEIEGLEILSKTFNLPPNLTSAGNYFAYNMFAGCCALEELSDDFQMPQELVTVGTYFAGQMFKGCYDSYKEDGETEEFGLGELPDVFTLPQKLVTVGNNFVNQMFYECRLLEVNDEFEFPQGLSQAEVNKTGNFSGTFQYVNGGVDNDGDEQDVAPEDIIGVLPTPNSRRNTFRNSNFDISGLANNWR